jgi:hypothetical protein
MVISFDYNFIFCALVERSDTRAHCLRQHYFLCRMRLFVMILGEFK